MSGYPPASSYGPPPGLTSLNGSYQPQHANDQQQYQQYNSTQYDYSNHNSDPNASAFSNNNAHQGGYQNQVPPFSAAAVASGVPPLPIFPQWQMNNDPQQQPYGNTAWGPPPPHHHEPLYPYQQQHQQQYQPQQPQHMHFDQHGQAPYNQYAAAGASFADTSFNATSGPSPMSYTPQPILHAQSQPPHSRPPSKPPQQAFAPPTGPKPRPPPDEGDVSEGEYVPTPKRLPPREKTFGRERKSWGRENGDRNGRQPSNDHYSPTQHFHRPDFSRRSSHDSPVRGSKGGLGDYEHKSKGTGVKARKEAARETARQTTRKSTPPDSRRQSLAGPPVIEQLPLPKRPAQVPQALLDARAKAQNAVLNLISLKVCFQDYLDEGIDEKVLTKVFADVGLSPGIRDAPKINSKPVSKPTLASAPQTTVLPGLSAIPPPPPPPAKAALPEKPVAALPPPKEDNGLGLGNRKPASTSAASAGNKAEERKDRIARLMALKSGAKVEKPAEPIVETAPQPPAPVVAPVASPAPIVPVVEKPVEKPIKKPIASPAPMQHPLPPKPKTVEASTPKTAAAQEPKAPEADVVVAAAPAKVDPNALLRQKMEALKANQPVVDKTAILKKKMEEREAANRQKQAEKAAKDANLRERIAALNARNIGQEELPNQFAEQSVKADPAQNFLADMFPADMPDFNPFAHVQQPSFPSPGMPAFPPPNGMPAIPGLFLGVQPAAPSPQLAVGLSTAPVNIRKRPIASDFDSGASTPPVYKKPFGHMDGPDKLILDVSESEDGEASEDDDGMDLDEVIDQYGRQANFPAKPSMRDLPPLSDFPPRRSYTAPTSAVGTPPVSQSMPRPAVRPEDLKKKESAIAEMRRKIAEAEERRKAKLAAVGSSSSTSKTPTPPAATAFVDRIETSAQIERLMSDASRKIEEDQQKLAAAQMLQEQKAVDLEKAQEEQRRKRQAELAANPPAVDADLQESQRRLEELRAEMQRIEAGMKKKLEDQKRLAETMEKLDVEADQQLEAQKEQLKEINDDIAEVEHEQGDAIVDSKSAEVDVPVATEGALADEEDRDQASSASESDNQSHQEESTLAKSPAPIEHAEPAADVAQDDVGNGVDKHEILGDEIYDDVPTSVVNGSPAKSVEGNEVEMISGSESTPMVESSESDRSSKSQERGVSVQKRSSSSDSSDQSMDESSSAEMDIDEPLAELSAGAEDAQVQESSSSESSSSSEESSSSSEDDSDNDDSRHPEDGNIQDEEMPDVSDTSSSGPSSSESESESEEEEEEYEPPAAASPPPPAPVAIVASVARSASDSLAPETISRPAASSPAVSTPRIIEDPPAPFAVEPAQRRPATVRSAEVINANTANRASSQPSAVSKPSESVKKSHFTPYESPLKLLHSYRFHPQFTKEVPGGYRSVTYSNNIRENDDFCRYELQGGTCNDEKCLDQHFRDAGISDQAVLEILSNSKGLEKEEKMKWISGLKQVLGELRAKNVSNFEGIAQGIVEFRRKFFEDKGTALPPDNATSA